MRSRSPTLLKEAGKKAGEIQYSDVILTAVLDLGTAPTQDIDWLLDANSDGLNKRLRLWPRMAIPAKDEPLSAREKASAQKARTGSRGEDFGIVNRMAGGANAISD
jgi:hypothetical protein